MVIQKRIELVTHLLPTLYKPLIIAEVGVAEGNFSRDMLVAGATLLYMVDNWQTIKGQQGDGGFQQTWHDMNYNKAMLQTVMFSANRRVLKGKSVEMAQRVPDESLSLVYLDADHSLEGVMADLNAWYPKLVQGGVMAGHDYLNPDYGVYEAVNAFRDEVFTIPENSPIDASFYFFKD
jgi:hypothetical protein